MPVLLSQAISSTQSCLVITVTAFMGPQAVPSAQIRLHWILSVEQGTFPGGEMFQLHAEKSWQSQAIRRIRCGYWPFWILGLFWCDYNVDERDNKTEGW